jgi:hypothetical protein
MGNFRQENTLKACMKKAPSAPAAERASEISVSFLCEK